MKIKVAVVFGGQSSEHAISILSGASIIKNLNTQKYEAHPVYISKEGRWYYVPISELSGKDLQSKKNGIESIEPASRTFTTADGRSFAPDVMFPALHGPYGEDGKIQGMFDMLGIPFAGCGLLSSALAMDKISSKRIFKYCKLPVVPFVGLYAYQWNKQKKDFISEIRKKLGYPVFVKPSNLGSSIGISKVMKEKELEQAIKEASRYDARVIVEKGVNAREIECSVMGNSNPVASQPGEIVPARDFYDYVAKYDDDNTRLLMPAPLSTKQVARVQKLAIAAYLALNCVGFARVDFLMDKKRGIFYVSEVNTIPGFTEYSMFHRLWSLSGLSYPEVLDKIITFALDRCQ